MSKQEVEILKAYPHHNTFEFCENRPKYRQGRKLTAVKVYTVNDESQHLLIRGVPSVNLNDEVEKLCNRYGHVSSIKQVQFEEQEQFTHCFHVVYTRIQSARFAKKQMDTKNFFGGVLHVCYAPELESLDQSRAKLITRISEVARRLHKLGYIQENQSDQSRSVDECSKAFSENKQQYESIPQTHNRWLEGGLKCSYIEPKSSSSSIVKEIVTKQLNPVKNVVPPNSSILHFVPKQLHQTSMNHTTKKPNRVIFHN
ncbi:RNA-binding protein 48 [Adelges cooleyi]|uniref:RNA-binding protein 48 n=1 Tax=Adelges cooleyi TaxID=133065 RepID=UPI00217F8E32|nr:RNA-binding protein 48 [Adelges cooleyi]XP_050420546.1 RNA-binding protein 48 [Adelges cooleyi]